MAGGLPPSLADAALEITGRFLPGEPPSAEPSVPVSAFPRCGCGNWPTRRPTSSSSWCRSRAGPATGASWPSWTRCPPAARPGGSRSTSGPRCWRWRWTGRRC
ncbi:hypothetical protein ACFQZ4_40405 [Catellatospora coxensis]